jgi:hypothetical protein
MIVEQSWHHTLIRDCLVMITSDGKIEPSEIESLESLVSQLIGGQDSQPIISYIIDHMDEIESIYPGENNLKEFYIDYVYRVATSASSINDRTVKAFVEIANNLNLPEHIFKSYLEEIIGQIGAESSPVSLVHLVKKISNNELGVFANIMDDLGIFSQNLDYDLDSANDEEKMHFMAYAYARRSVGAALVAQGVWGESELEHQIKFFGSTQIRTIHTRNFQEMASKQANELIQSYDDRLTLSLVSSIIIPFISKPPEETEYPKDLGSIVSADDLISFHHAQK